MLNGESMSEKFLSKSEFAALQGCAPSYVTKLGHQGRLVFSPSNPKLIDVAATLAGLQVSADPRKAYLRQHHLDERVRKHVTPLIHSDAPSDDKGGSGGKYWKAKALRESYLADLAALELARQRSELVERSRVEVAAKASERLLREGVLTVPAQLAPKLAAISDALQIEIRLREALRKVLEDHARIRADGLFEIAGQRCLTSGEHEDKEG